MKDSIKKRRMCLYVWLGHFVVQQKIEEVYINCVLIKHFFLKKKKEKQIRNKATFRGSLGCLVVVSKGWEHPGMRWLCSSWYKRRGRGWITKDAQGTGGVRNLGLPGPKATSRRLSKREERNLGRANLRPSRCGCGGKKPTSCTKRIVWGTGAILEFKHHSP